MGCGAIADWDGFSETGGWADDGLGPISEALPSQNLRVVDSGVVAPSSLRSLPGESLRL